MKKNSGVLLLLIAFITLSSGLCSKSDQAAGEQSTFPGSYIFTVDESPTEYVFIKTNGSVAYRDDILKTYDLKELAKEEKCKFHVRKSFTEAGKSCYSIQVDTKRTIWLSVGPSSNKQEVHLFASNGQSETEDPGGDNYKFQMHVLGSENGVKTVAIESVEKPGYYISSQAPGFQYASNLVTLQQANSPDKATKWSCRE